MQKLLSKHSCCLQCDLLLDYSSIFRIYHYSSKWRWDCICASWWAKCVVIEETMEGLNMKEEADSTFSIFMIFNSMSCESLANQRCSWEYFKYHPGKYLVAWHPKFKHVRWANYDGSKDSKMEQKILVRHRFVGLGRKNQSWYVFRQALN